MNAIETRALILSRGDFTLGPVDLCISQGEIFALLGRTGSGKTLLLETIAGFYAGEHAGDVLLFGRNPEETAPGECGIGFVYQDCGLFPHMTVEQNIAYGLRMHRIPEQETADRVEEIAGLLHIRHILTQYPSRISGGERQRTALARALVLSPRILLLDEPFCALDPVTRRNMYAEIRRIHDLFGCTILFVTHDFSEARQLAQRIGILLDGRLRAVTEAENLFNNHYEDEVTTFLGGSYANERTL